MNQGHEGRLWYLTCLCFVATAIALSLYIRAISLEVQVLQLKLEAYEHYWAVKDRSFSCAIYAFLESNPELKAKWISCTQDKVVDSIFKH